MRPIQPKRESFLCDFGLLGMIFQVVRVQEGGRENRGKTWGLFARAFCNSAPRRTVGVILIGLAATLSPGGVLAF
jgi:hypothetical protein